VIARMYIFGIICSQMNGIFWIAFYIASIRLIEVDDEVYLAPDSENQILRSEGKVFCGVFKSQTKSPEFFRIHDRNLVSLLEAAYIIG
jgi:hypothetical protein